MRNLNLSEITQVVNNELEIFNQKFRDSIWSENKIVNIIIKYLLKQKGKKIRPLLVILSSKIIGEVTDRTYRGATLVELLHTATLVHDDVVDESETRRGLPSINAIWKNKAGVLIGDYLLAKGLMIAVDGQDFDFLKVITNTVKRMSEGELLQSSKTRKLNNDEETYYKIISDKTASLIATCCEIGARAVSNDESKINAMKNYGEYLGIAFQIRDDILDYVGKKTILGKPLGGDIREKKLTLPLIFALKNSNQKTANEILSVLKKKEKNMDVNKVIDFVIQNGGIEYSENAARSFGVKAKDELNIFENQMIKNTLSDLVDYILERKK
ncbi:MAG: polyprenyl synthetase family protein [Melioribacteraceae bacterium]|nr:polyprenyl synthetase family protein [Melioribacteraceae bacterium]